MLCLCGGCAVSGLCLCCVRAVSGLCGADSRVQAGREEEHQGRLLQEQMQVRTGVFLLFFSLSLDAHLSPFLTYNKCRCGRMGLSVNLSFSPPPSPSLYYFFFVFSFFSFSSFPSFSLSLSPFSVFFRCFPGAYLCSCTWQIWFLLSFFP